MDSFSGSETHYSGWCPRRKLLQCQHLQRMAPPISTSLENGPLAELPDVSRYVVRTSNQRSPSTHMAARKSFGRNDLGNSQEKEYQCRKLTLTRSASEAIRFAPRWRFGLVCYFVGVA